MPIPVTDSFFFTKLNLHYVMGKIQILEMGFKPSTKGSLLRSRSAGLRPNTLLNRKVGRYNDDGLAYNHDGSSLCLGRNHCQTRRLLRFVKRQLWFPVT